ncbi:MAG: hypothetical protein AB7V50_02385 [Vampirovibrionia bacterium]
MVHVLSPNVAKQVLKLADLSPSMQRGIIGVTAIATHTAIDAVNPFADSETRKYAAVRSMVKNFICTLSGVLTREIGQKLGEYAVSSGKITPPANISKAAFASSVGKIFAIIGAVVSIFVIDVPFINKLMNVVMNKIYPDGVKKPVPNASTDKKVDFNA